MAKTPTKPRRRRRQPRGRLRQPALDAARLAEPPAPQPATRRQSAQPKPERREGQGAREPSAKPKPEPDTAAEPKPPPNPSASRTRRSRSTDPLAPSAGDPGRRGPRVGGRRGRRPGGDRRHPVHEQGARGGSQVDRQALRSQDQGLASRLLAPGLSGEHHGHGGDGRLQPRARAVPVRAPDPVRVRQGDRVGRCRGDGHQRPPGDLPGRRGRRGGARGRAHPRQLDHDRHRGRARRDLDRRLVLGRDGHGLLPDLPRRVPELARPEALRPRDAPRRDALPRGQRRHPARREPRALELRRPAVRARRGAGAREA